MAEFLENLRAKADLYPALRGWRNECYETRLDFAQPPLSLSFAVDNDVHSDLSGVSLEVLDGGSTPFLSLPVTCNYGTHAAAAAIGQQVVKFESASFILSLVSLLPRN